MIKPTTVYAHKVLRLLEKTYPNAKMILQYGNEWELLVAVILSAQCTDMMVNKVTEKLFPKYKKLSQNTKIKGQKYKSKIKRVTPEILEIIRYTEVPLTELEQDIKSTGFYHNKAKSVQAAAKYILEHYNGKLPRTIDAMIKIPGVGRKTANVVLGNAFKIYEGIAVDTHVTKQSQALGLTNNKTPEKIEQDLMKLFDKKDWFKPTYLLIEHGRTIRTNRRADPTYEKRFLKKLKMDNES